MVLEADENADMSDDSDDIARQAGWNFTNVDIEATKNAEILSLKKRLDEVNKKYEKEKKRRSRGSPFIQPYLDKVQMEVLSFNSRGFKKMPKPKLIHFIIGMKTKGHMSNRRGIKMTSAIIEQLKEILVLLKFILYQKTFLCIQLKTKKNILRISFLFILYPY